jgi:protein tyrosine/serine phosphatase
MLAVVFLLGPGCVYISRHTLRGACASDLGSPIRNFCVAEPQILWRGERPTRDDMQWLVEHRVGTVVSIQMNDRDAFEAARVNEDLSHAISYYHVSGFGPLQVLSPSHLDKHLALFIAIMKTAPKPVYVHCRAGVDRTGLLVEGYRVLIEAADPEEAIAEMGRFHSPWQFLDARYIRGLSEPRRAEILREAADWASRLRPTARIDCARARCTYVIDTGHTLHARG